uniref:Uncharacterized conserved protein, LabA/DUF88 family n=1 Tax=Candidatus Kentrum sp. FW TaxID=2126338 RepID=A0A450S452_9GAMM|nr:MAG: Uncharacterized conserved protein, LabA/DUF88 family [Candidatus Kentron sp. FW]VFJ70849.1 MAG: Uncharacterized conserved protein, LabA/DUF88 family [Candidatus Kentron sp. FW]
MSKKVQQGPEKANHILQKAIVYIDGYNLYYGLRAAYRGRYKWLDLQALARDFLKPDMELAAVKYFTAITKDTSDSHRRQAIYLKALEAYCDRLEIIHGRFLSKTKQCRACGAQHSSFEEKKTDVNIACHILNDAYQDRFDCCYLVSGDSDLVPPLEIIRQYHPDKKTIVAHPPRRKSEELCQTAHGWFAIGERKFKRNQLPETIRTKSSGQISRLKEWK